MKDLIRFDKTKYFDNLLHVDSLLNKNLINLFYLIKGEGRRRIIYVI